MQAIIQVLLGIPRLNMCFFIVIISLPLETENIQGFFCGVLREIGWHILFKRIRYQMIRAKSS